MIRRFDIRDDDGVLYLRRWKMRLPFGYRLMLHHILREDHDRCHHDHPWAFWTFGLRGWYIEDVMLTHGVGRPYGYRMERMRPGRLRFRRPEHRHRIEAVAPGGCWTLILRGRRVREWGFWSRAGRWVQHSIFLTKRIPGRAAWCEDRDEQETT